MDVHCPCWQTIQNVKNKYPGQGIIVGTGPTADNLSEIRDAFPKATLIGINRAICLRKDFDFIFVDHPKTIQDIEEHIGNTQYICMPMFSRDEVNINHATVQRYAHKILLFVWSYKNWSTLTAPDYSLNDILLYISWGGVQSAIHFAQKIGIDALSFRGVDGGTINGSTISKRVADVFKITPSKKQIGEYKRAATKIKEIAAQLGIQIHNG